jgi:diguanylate cyclase (GGDEF)-like protein
MTELLMLDVRTLAVTSSVSGFLMAATMFGIYVAGMRSRALVDWTLAGLATGTGFLTGHLLQTIDLPLSPWMGGALANALIGLGHGLVLIGVQRYLGHRPWTWLILGVIVVLFSTNVFFPEVRESLRLRVIQQSGFYVIVAGYAGWLLWTASQPGMQRFHRAAAVVLILFAAFLAVRLGYAVLSPALTTSFVQDPFQVGAFLAAMIYGFCLTMALAVVMFREKHVELLGLASKDPLTGLNNRLSLDRVAERQMSLLRDRKQPLSIMLIDIDHFKRINDRHGHQTGDEVLCEVARRINEVIRDSDFAFRFGGEEFLLMLPGADLIQGTRVANRLRQCIAKTPIRARGANLDLTASFGIIECRPGEESWEDCVRRADKALYRAKDAGRDRVIADG